MTAVLLDLNKYRLQRRVVVPATRKLILREVCTRKLYHTGKFSLYDRSGVICTDIRRIEFVHSLEDVWDLEAQYVRDEDFELDVVEGLQELSEQLREDDFLLLVKHIESISKPRELGCLTFSNEFRLDFMRLFGLDAVRSGSFE